MANDINLSLQQTQSRHNPSKAVFCYVPCHPCDIGRVLFIPLYFLVHRFFQLCFFSISQPGVVTAHSVCVVCLSQDLGQSHHVCEVCLGQDLGQSQCLCDVTRPGSGTVSQCLCGVSRPGTVPQCLCGVSKPGAGWFHCRIPAAEFC